MKFIFLLFTIFISLTRGENIMAQSVIDTSEVISTTPLIKKGSIFNGRPGKSMLMSLVIPGAGQIYNKSYLRVPFVWGTIGTVGYFLVNNTREYQIFRDAYISKIDGTEITTPTYLKEGKFIPFTKITLNDLKSIQNPETIRKFRDEANKNRQISIVILAFAWLLNGVDAFVDAHLKDFDIDEDLSFRLESGIEDDANAPLKLGLYVQF